MATTESPALHQSAPRSIMQLLTKSWVDKVLAGIATVPFIHSIVANYHNIHWNVPSILWLVDLLILISTMVFRKAPERVTPNPWFWALAFVATYWGFLTWRFQDDGRALAPAAVANTIAVLGTAIELWGRASLGRSIGFVPAQRDIVIHGAYRFVRHPIYSGVFIGVVADSLTYWSFRNVLLNSVFVSLFMIKSLVEESFLKEDAAYAAYLKKVRWHWFPGLA
jgi:isoprenylcysteine carboxyl methyltransferase (ICMT) family protein YpbQ